MSIACIGAKAKSVFGQRVLFSRVRGSSFPVLLAPVSTFSSSSTVGFQHADNQHHSSSTKPKCFLIVGEYQNIIIDGDRFGSLDDHVSQFPPVSLIPKGRLINVQTGIHLQSSDDCRYLLWTGLLNSTNCKNRHLFPIDPYNDDNVGVIKDLNMLAFKDLVFAEDKGQTPNHSQYIEFVERFLCKLHGPAALNQLPDWGLFVRRAHFLTDDQLKYHSVFFGNEDAAVFFSDVHRIVRKEFPARRLTIEAERILSAIDCVYSDTVVVKTCHSNFLLRFLLGIHQREQRALNLLLFPKRFNARHPPGSAAVDAHRIAMAHAIEREVISKIKKAFPKIDQHLLQSYVRKEVVELLRYLFPHYTQAALDAFWADKKLWNLLNMSHRLPTPSIFLYSSPTSEVCALDGATRTSPPA